MVARAVANASVLLWAVSGVLGLALAPLAFLLYPRVGAPALPYLCASLGAAVSIAIARPLRWALAARHPALPGPAAPRKARRWIPWVVGLVSFAPLSLLMYAVLEFVNGAFVAQKPYMLDCRILGERVQSPGPDERLFVEYECTPPSRDVVSGSFTVPAREAHGARVGRRFSVPAQLGRLGLWTLEDRNAVQKAATSEE